MTASDFFPWLAEREDEIDDDDDEDPEEIEEMRAKIHSIFKTKPRTAEA